MTTGSPRRWKQKTALMAGLVAGSLSLVYQTFVTGDALRYGGFVSYAAGAVFGTALLFCGIAALRNWLVIGRRKN